jgi:molecular chaperone DnaJ
MKLKEAQDILGLSKDATPEEAKKKYRDLAKEYHPDINKEIGAEEKFKKINQAYHVIQNGEEPDPVSRANPFHRSPFNPFNDFFQRQETFHPADNIDVSTTISFRESVLGCKKDIKFSRQTKCKDCNGQGQTQLNNGCVKCGGKGQVASKRGNMIMFQVCDKCQGRVQTANCSACSTEGIMNAESSVNVSIPGGIQNGNVLRLGGMGHYVGSSFMFTDQHTDVHLRVIVKPEPELSIQGMHVVSILEISLLEALRGCEKSVMTIDGKQVVKIASMARNRDEIVLPKMGVNRVGDQKVILDVQYPKIPDKLIEALTKEI